MAVPSRRRPACDAQSVYWSGPHRAPILGPVLAFALARGRTVGEWRWSLVVLLLTRGSALVVVGSSGL